MPTSQHPAPLPETQRFAALQPEPRPALTSDRRALRGARFYCLIPALFLAGCAKSPGVTEQKPTPPVVVKNATKESDLATLTLTPQAEQRLGITLATLAYRKVPRARSFGADIVLPPDRRTVVSAPVSGTLMDAGAPKIAGMPVRKGEPLYRLLPYVAPERDLRLQLERDVEAAKTRVDAARVRWDRSEQLLKEKAGSVKAVAQAREELDLANHDLKAAQSRLERFIGAPLSGDTALTLAAPRDGIILNIQVIPGQAVPSGAALFEVADLSVVWVRVPVYVGELGAIDATQGARIRGLADPPGTAGRPARAASAPPSADSSASTADLYFELSSQAATGEMYRPGQRVMAELPLRGEDQSLALPWASVLYDANGGAWVYENIAPQVYTRRRVEVLRVVGSLVLLARGPAEGAKIVVDGAEELFGSEFGAGK